jgi:ActR/RegA family two-component response regulator
MILYCCQDLIFSTKIRSTAESLGVASKPVKDAAKLATVASEGDASVGAVMVDLELGEEGLTLIDAAREHLPEATVIAFGSHVAKDVLDAAKGRGAHEVLPRSAFTERLPTLLQQYGAGDG